MKMGLKAESRHYFLSFILVALAGCATPQYQTAYRYEPPTDAQGRSCVQGCEEKKVACQAGCQARYQACQKEVAPLVEEQYLKALREYELDLKRYTTVLRHYEIQYYNCGPYGPWDYYHGYYYPWHLPTCTCRPTPYPPCPHAKV